MPAYFTAEFSFPKDKLYKEFVRDVYNSFFTSGFDFKSGYWFGEDMTLEEIISWNQKHLESGFRLGFRQHVKDNYKQILLQSDIYDEMRLFWMYQGKEIVLHLIIPEYDMISQDEDYVFLIDRINPIIDLAKTVWNTALPQAIQTSLEFDEAGISWTKINKGQIPNINPFCILDSLTFQKLSNSLMDMSIEHIMKNGVLVIDKSVM